MFLLVPLWQQISRLPNKPPVTLALVAVMVGMYIQPDVVAEWVPPVAKACLQPYRVLEGWEVDRMLWSAFLHGDDMHLYWNMVSFIWKGVVLEPALGSVKYAALLLELLVGCQVLLVACARALAAAMPGMGGSYYSSCAVGFSGVLFALKVVLNARSPEMESVYGFRVPAKYVCWVELIVISVLTPNASFLGHLAGILAGLAHVRLFDRGAVQVRPRGATNVLVRLYRGLLRLLTVQRPYSGSAQFAGPAGAAAGGGRRDPVTDSDMSPEDIAEEVRRQREIFYAERQRRGVTPRSCPAHSPPASRQRSSRPGSSSDGGTHGSTHGSANGDRDNAAGTRGGGAWRDSQHAWGNSGMADVGPETTDGWPSPPGARVHWGRPRGLFPTGVAALLAVLAAAVASNPGPGSFRDYVAGAAHSGLGPRAGGVVSVGVPEGVCMCVHCACMWPVLTALSVWRRGSVYHIDARSEFVPSPATGLQLFLCHPAA